MQIANPIYDVVFKYLMEDSKVAKLFISTIIEEDIEVLEFLPQESIVDLDQRILTVYRLDFSARIKSPSGDSKQVLIEIQKAKFATDIMRFRRYLGEQYGKPENSFSAVRKGREVVLGLPIITIYLLGNKLDNLESPVISVNRSYRDRTDGRLIEVKNEFVESLSHDSHIIQIPRLKKRYKTELEHLLSVFDQDNRTSDIHILNVDENDYPEKYRFLIRRLQRAIAEPNVRKTMDVEDEVLAELEDLERLIARKDEALEEKDKALEEKDKALEEKDKALDEKDKALEEKDKVLEDQIKIIEEQKKLLSELLKKHNS